MHGLVWIWPRVSPSCCSPWWAGWIHEDHPFPHNRLMSEVFAACNGAHYLCSGQPPCPHLPCLCIRQAVPDNGIYSLKTAACSQDLARAGGRRQHPQHTVTCPWRHIGMAGLPEVQHPPPLSTLMGSHGEQGAAGCLVKEGCCGGGPSSPSPRTLTEVTNML